MYQTKGSGCQCSSTSGKWEGERTLAQDLNSLEKI